MVHPRHKVSTLRWMAAAAIVAWWILFIGQAPVVSMIGATLLTAVFIATYYFAAKEYYDEHGYPGWE